MTEIRADTGFSILLCVDLPYLHTGCRLCLDAQCMNIKLKRQDFVRPCQTRNTGFCSGSLTTKLESHLLDHQQCPPELYQRGPSYLAWSAAAGNHFSQNLYNQYWQQLLNNSLCNKVITVFHVICLRFNDSLHRLQMTMDQHVQTLQYY